MDKKVIDQNYIDSAKNIRFEFLSLYKKLDSYQSELGDLYTYLQKVMKELEEINEKQVSTIKTKSDAATVTDQIVKKLGEIEAKEETLIRLVSPINDRIERLKKDEETLYDTLKQKYPTLSNEDLIKEIHSQLEK